MKPDENLIFLMDRANAIAGSDYKLAKLIGCSTQQVSDWRNGRATCSPERMALLAGVAGFDPAQTALRALVKKHEGTDLGDRLMRVLGKALLATGVGLGSAGASAMPTGSIQYEPSNTMYIRPNRQWQRTLCQLVLRRKRVTICKSNIRKAPSIGAFFTYSMPCCARTRRDWRL
jgi:hypothetical protein